MEFDYIDDILPSELLMVIAEQNHDTFVAMRSISELVRGYTNEQINRYKDSFLIFTEEKDMLGWKKIYTKLPNGSKQGLCRKYYSDGKIYAEFEYKDDKIHGTYREYYNDGQINNESEYIDGKVQGSQRYYLPNGKIWGFFESPGFYFMPSIYPHSINSL